MKTLVVLFALCVAGSLAAQQSGQGQNPSGQRNTGDRTSDRQGTQAQMSSKANVDVDKIIAEWKDKPREAAQKMIEKYGQPHEATANRLIWHNNGPWKFTELVNEEIDHNFPKPHKDMLLQIINYKVPVDKISDLAAYDGSVIVERTKGELGARCDKEDMNFLALNLAYDIISGKLNVEDARKQYAQTAAQYMKGERPAYTTGLQFMRPVNERTGDPDETMLMETMKGMMK